MTTEQDYIPQWIAEGQSRGATWLIVVRDTQTGNDSPVYVMPGENLERKREACNSGFLTEVTAPFDL
jgi:hypothetical protein